LFRHASVASLAQSLDTPLGHQPPAAAKDPFAALLTLQSGTGPGLFAFIRPKGWRGATGDWQRNCRKCRSMACKPKD